MPRYILFWVPRALEISLLGLSHLHERTYNRQTGTLQAISEDREARFTMNSIYKRLHAVQIYVFLHSTCMYECMYVCMYGCMCICIYIYTHVKTAYTHIKHVLHLRADIYINK